MEFEETLTWEQEQKYIQAFNEMPSLFTQKSQVVVNEAEKWGQRFFLAGMQAASEEMKRKCVEVVEDWCWFIDGCKHRKSEKCQPCQIAQKLKEL